MLHRIKGHKIKPKKSNGDYTFLLKMLFIQFLLKLNFVTYLFSVLSSRGIQTLNEIGSMTKEHSITSCTTDHRQHCQPHVCQALRRETTITNAKHVGHRFEHGP